MLPLALFISLGLALAPQLISFQKSTGAGWLSQGESLGEPGVARRSQDSRKGRVAMLKGSLF